MDNLTHSLTGAVLGQMGLKKKTGLGMATLIIAANIPDIDAIAVLMGGHQHLAIRRGITHGPIALLLLPILLAGIMIWFDGWQTRRGKRPEARLPIHKGWLLALAYIGTISHPAMDWLNSYGIRLLEPFSSQWFYGDSIFIIDIWIWIALIAGVWISRRREKAGDANWQRPAWVSFATICAYVFANGLITGKAEAMMTAQVKQQHGIEPTIVVANPMPVQFWKREMHWRSADQHGFGWYTVPNDLMVHGKVRPTDINDDVRERLSSRSADAKAYLFWSRMPVLSERENVILVSDQRFSDPMVGDRFTLKIPYPKDRLVPTGK